MTFVNIISQTVQVFGFIRLGRMPNMRKGNAARPRNGTGMCSCSSSLYRSWIVLPKAMLSRLIGREAEKQERPAIRPDDLMPRQPPQSWSNRREVYLN